MATLSIRNLPDHVHKALRLRAAKNGRSMEAEARSVLEQGVAPAQPKPRTDAEWDAFLADVHARTFPEGVPKDFTVDAFLAGRRADWGEDQD
jgi:hypothetical protein